MGTIKERQNGSRNTQESDLPDAISPNVQARTVRYTLVKVQGELEHI